MKKKRFAVFNDSEAFYLSRFKRIDKYFPTEEDHRVSYYVIPNNCYVSVIGEQKNGMLVPYKNKLFLFRLGHCSSEELIELLPKETNPVLYGFRAFGIGGILSGLLLHLRSRAS